MLTIFHMLNGDLDILCSETPIPIFCPVNIKLSILKSGFIVLYILDVSFLSDTFIVDNFYSVACFVFLLLVYFYEGMLWILEKGNLSIFLSVKVVRYLPVPVLEIYSPIFFFLEVFLVLTFIFGLWSILNFFFYMLSVWSKKGVKITSFFHIECQMTKHHLLKGYLYCKLGFFMYVSLWILYLVPLAFFLYPNTSATLS